MSLQEVQHFHVVMQRRCRSRQLVKVGGKCRHPAEGLVQVLASFEIVEGEQQRSCFMQPVEVGRLQGLRAFQPQIDNLAAGARRFAEYVDFCAQRPTKLSAVRRAAARRDPYSIRTVLKKALQAGNGAEGILQVIEPEFQKRVFTNLQVSLIEKIAGFRRAQAHADLGQTKPQYPAG